MQQRFSWPCFARSQLMGRMFNNQGKLRWDPDSTSSQAMLDCSHPQECFSSRVDHYGNPLSRSQNQAARFVPRNSRPTSTSCSNLASLVMSQSGNFELFAQTISIWPSGARTTYSAVTRSSWGRGPPSSMQCSSTIWPRGKKCKQGNIDPFHLQPKEASRHWGSWYWDCEGYAQVRHFHHWINQVKD